jgi:uncharacterized membrane protein
LHDRSNSFFLAAFISLLYFLHGAAEAWVSADNRLLGLAEASLASIFFISATLHLRNLNQLAQQQESPKQ